MKKILLLAILICGFANVNAQTYTSGHLFISLSDTMSHDSTTCQGYFNQTYHFTVDSSFVGDSVNVVDTFGGGYLVYTAYNYTGASPWSFSQVIWGYGQYDTYISPGDYMHFYTPLLKVAGFTDTIFVTPTEDSLQISNPCSWSSVSGDVYIDNNSNCIYDAGDQALDSIAVRLAEHVSSPVDSIYWGDMVLFGTTHYYRDIQQSWLTNYTVSIPPEFAFIFPASPCFSGTSYTLTTVPYTTADFPLICSGNMDVQCNILSAGKARLHKPFFIHPYVSNTGCDTAGGQLRLVLDSRVIYDASLSSHPADTVHGDTLIWNYHHLSSISAGAYWNSFTSDVYLTMDTTVAAGDTLCFRVFTGIPLADINTANNDQTICIPVVYSFDPNSKEVSPAGTGPQHATPVNAKTLTYTIHFQNTGSDVAEDIRVIDTLDSHFNMHSLKILGASHKMTPVWLTPNVVAFDFKGINLPDSFSNEPGSHGQIQFSIDLNAGVPIGTVLKNTGYIYFDLNPAVVTNTTSNTLVIPTYVPAVKPTEQPRIYPNPVTDQLFIENLDGGVVEIMNMNGSTAMKQSVTNSKAAIDVSRLSPAIYMIKAINNNNVTVMKFTKE